MSDEWTEKEVDACVRTYLWMRDSETNGFTPVKKRVRDALRAGPVSERSDGSIEYRFQNISWVLDQSGKPRVDGYRPAANVGSNTAATIQTFIDRYDQNRHSRRVNWLVNSLPVGVVTQASVELAEGKKFEYSDSTEYDAIVNGIPIPPKKIIGYAGQIFFGSPLNSENFSGGENTPCFNKLESAGLSIAKKGSRDLTESESGEFRTLVTEHKKRRMADEKPSGRNYPQKRSVSSVAFVRSPDVVAFVEERAQGVCELCRQKAPFLRTDDTLFLEVHHVVPLSDGGPDSVENAVALCPNCHRECHHGQLAHQKQKLLLARLAANSGPYEK